MLTDEAHLFFGQNLRLLLRHASRGKPLDEAWLSKITLAMI